MNTLRPSITIKRSIFLALTFVAFNVLTLPSVAVADLSLQLLKLTISSGKAILPQTWYTCCLRIR
jgi:hypothetical protein